jgi:Ca-activated chloride channel family protein
MVLLALSTGSLCDLARADWPSNFVGWWLTPDQQGQRLADRGKFSEAAERFTTPERIGAAYYRAGDFESAAAVLGRATTPEGVFNRGNALVLLGRYEEAIASYEKALEARPDWTRAEENLAIARARLAALAPPEDDYGGTGGKLGADEIVINQDPGRSSSSDETEVIDAGDQALSEDAMRALWLRRVETRPADFLAAKFSQQLATSEDAP